MCAAIAQLVEQGTENPCVLGQCNSELHSEPLTKRYLIVLFGRVAPFFLQFTAKKWALNSEQPQGLPSRKMILNHFPAAE